MEIIWVQLQIVSDVCATLDSGLLVSGEKLQNEHSCSLCHVCFLSDSSTNMSVTDYSLSRNEDYSLAYLRDLVDSVNLVILLQQ